MKLVWKGIYKSEEQLPKGKLPWGAVPFKEPKTPMELSLKASVWVLPVVALAFALVYIKSLITGWWALPLNMWGVLLALVAALPHELLHAVCFPKDAVVALYASPKNLMAFVFTTWPVSKRRFIGLSLLPGLALGLLPMLIWLAVPDGSGGGLLFTFGLVGMTLGVGDYLNAFNAARQMPKGALTQLSGFHSYWFMPVVEK